ncbi:penicillin-binding protein 1C [Tianweitania sp. BSSL-BM11]|uniref:peptidoglycan glycosyltransferase n=1 Tax=Tianweitania aestuarii TaxID=2814886 RepID=A0ABS5RW14_9HYPH|nr:penicillin-binding protein 1C [Tianweitania aestuarii]MBS9720965.1 penicillin-binding protein 1C [Tianweitania aestuarii]
MRLLRKLTIGLGLAAGLTIGAWQSLLALDRAYPPPLDQPPAVSREVIDRNGALLRAFAAPDGRWRLTVDLDTIDPALIDMLVTYEDRRFWDHHGVDPFAVLRAAGQLVTHGRIVSGGSTITMQLARLLEPREERSMGAKLRQALRALQIERRLSKREILERYLTLAPYGGNLEGVRSASLAWFGREPRGLGVGEQALLVALPQSPESRRPDRHHDRAVAARDRVLARMVEAGLLEAPEAARAKGDLVPSRRRALPALAAHATHCMQRDTPDATRMQLTLDAGVQSGLEAVAREAAVRLGPKLSVAMIMADAGTGEIIGDVGSAAFFDNQRAGWIDMTRVPRSPGSTLKPFIYALAFEEGLVAQETIIEDRPADFAGYRPKNFDMHYQGDVPVRQALQMSLNVPAIRLLDAVGPARLVGRFRQAGVSVQLPRGEKPGLAIGLGGAGLTLRDLVQLYTALANRGRAAVLTEVPQDSPILTGMMEPQAVWQIGDMLSGVMPPEGAPDLRLAYKTGTSYGHRDAWSIGYDGRHVLGVWVGRADGGSVPGLSGFASAAPILFEGFKRSGVGQIQLPPAPAGALRQNRADLPVTLRRFTSALDTTPKVSEAAPQIIFPPEGARMALDAASGEPLALSLKLQGGRAPFRWLANGKPLEGIVRRRTASWTPDGAGFSTLTVIDAAGRAASVNVFAE